MGYQEGLVTQALIATKNRSLEVAIDWIFSNMDSLDLASKDSSSKRNLGKRTREEKPKTSYDASPIEKSMGMRSKVKKRSSAIGKTA